MSEPQATCPVCAQVAETGPGHETCQVCGWTMSGPLQAGPVTDQMRLAFGAKLHRRQRELDAHVVARIAADPAPYQDCVRGGTPDAAEWKAARKAAARDVAGAMDDRALRAALGRILEGLRPGVPARVIEVSDTGIIVIEADVDRLGVVHVAEADQRRPGGEEWTSLLPMLSAAKHERQFQLAGGVDGLDWQQVWTSLDIALPDFAGGRPVVVCRPAGWAVLERAASKLSGAAALRVASGPDHPRLLGILTELAVQVPLTHAYKLMVAVVDPGTGRVSVRTRQLFAKGDRAGTRRSIRLRRLPGDDGDLTLAVFADSTTHGEPLVLASTGSGAAAQPEGGPQPQGGPAAPGAFSVDAVLDGPGQLRITGPRTVECTQSWDQVRGRVPRRVQAITKPVDLVFAIDYSGPRDKVGARKELVTAMLGLLTSAYPSPRSLRVGVVTCTDHVYGRDGDGNERRPVAGRSGLVRPRKAVEWLNGRQQANVRYRPAAPVEDLLHEAAAMLSGSHAAGRAAAVLTVTGRPPHPWPKRGSGAVLPCPNEYIWRAEMNTLTGQVQARCMLVADKLRDGANEFTEWNLIGPHGLFEIADVTARQIAVDLGLLVKPEQRIPLPLADDKEGDR